MWAVPEDLHLVEGVGVDDVESIVTVHEDLGKAHFANDWAHDERESMRAGHVVRMIAPIEGDGHLGPPRTC